MMTPLFPQGDNGGHMPLRDWERGAGNSSERAEARGGGRGGDRGLGVVLKS